MNIVVDTYAGSTCCRPDTTWERENRDFYVPGMANELLWTPVVFARIAKAGKCVGKKFASRYYDGIGFGILIYIGDLMPETAAASCADHSTVLPFPLYNPVVLDNGENLFQVLKDGQSIFEGPTGDGAGELYRQKIEDAICRTSQLTSLRTGDMIAAELSQMTPFAARPEGKVSLRATYCGNILCDFSIIF